MLICDSVSVKSNNDESLNFRAGSNESTSAYVSVICSNSAEELVADGALTGGSSDELLARRLLRVYRVV